MSVGEESTQNTSLRTFHDEEELFSFVGKSEALPIRIHVVGPPDDARILITPASAVVRQKLDHVQWVAGANCGQWMVKFDKGDRSPLTPPGPYRSGGPTGGDVEGDLGVYPYSVEALDLRTGDTVAVDPDLVVVPMY